MSRKPSDPRKVAISRAGTEYSGTPPFDPDTRYPEYSAVLDVATAPNAAYEAVRNCLYLLGFDRENFGTPAWNPLGEVIRPGQRIVIKPNFVLSDHYRGGELFSVITHPSVLRAVIDYVFIACGREGTIIIADTPQLDCDFQELLARTHLKAVSGLYESRMRFPIDIRDLRHSWFKYEGENYFASQDKRHDLPGDPEGSRLIDLGHDSAFAGLADREYYGADFNRKETALHHTNGRHAYQVSGTILNSDVLISVPKLKVHKKVGVTLNCKGLVGTVTNKNLLVHYSLGSVDQGGDQYPPDVLGRTERSLIRIQRVLYDRLLARRDRLGNRVFLALYQPFRTFLRPMLRSKTEKIGIYDGGNWHGNDSAWRMVSDLVKIALFADRDGIIREEPQRTTFSFVDGIMGGENNGPLFPDARKAGVVLAGSSFLGLDMTAARLMGFDPMKLAWVRDLLGNRRFDLGIRGIDDLSVVSTVPEWKEMFRSSDRFLAFKPHPGWIGHIEVGAPGDLHAPVRSRG
jgi:uncharacterized protein (DUF362 family)